MKKFIKENWKFILFVVISGFLGGFFASLYMYDSFTEEMLKQIQEQNISRGMYAIVGTIQIGLLYGLLLAILGIILSKKVGLWKKFKIEKKALIITIILSIIGGLILYPGDSILFGTIEMVKESYMTKPSFNYFIMSILYGGVIEEVMLRLFFMSLIVFIISKIFYRKESVIPSKAYIVANIVSALLFALGHIPSTMILNPLTPLVLVRCFIMNGSYGLVFGYLYRKYGIEYSMMCHGLCHFISKILMLIFI